MKTLSRGLTLIQAVLIIAFIALIVWLGVPVYDNWSMRSRVSELMYAATSTRAALSEGYAVHHSWSAEWMSLITLAPSGVVATASIDQGNGRLMVLGAEPTAGAVITFIPQITAGGKVDWACTGTPSKYMPASCR